MNQFDISIILPVYNARKYIEKTLDSIICQTFNRQKYEIIIVDDGATDGTGEICRQYASNYANIVYLCSSNSGVSVSRNKGISVAKGKYITFCDHDDEYDPDYLECIMLYANKYQADVIKVGTSFSEEFSEGLFRNREDTFIEKVVDATELIIKYNELPIAFFGVWNGAYKAELFRNKEIRFPENMKYGNEDIYFNTLVLPHCKVVAFCNKCLYKHYRRLSQSTSAQFHKERIDSFSDCFRLQNSILKSYFTKDSWTYEYAILYARTITGLLSYCYSTSNNDGKLVFKKSIKIFMQDNPYELKKDFFTVIRIFKRQKKYGVVLILLYLKQYGLLLDIWKKYRKM